MENLERITKLLKRDLQNLKSKNIKFRNSVKNDNLKLPELIGTYSRTEKIAPKPLSDDVLSYQRGF